MKLRVVWIGKTKEPAINSLAADYLKRAGDLIRTIFDKGYFRRNPPIEHFWKDRDLDAMRAHPEFRRWLDANIPEPKKDK